MRFSLGIKPSVALVGSLGILSGCDGSLGSHLGGAGAETTGDGDSGDGDGDGDSNGDGDGDGDFPSRPPSDDPDEGPTEFSCDEELATPSPGMRRLTRRQYENTLFDLVARALGDEAASSVYDEVAPLIDRLPEDQRAILPQDLHGTFRRLDQSVQQSHVDYWYEVGVLVGQILSRDENLVTLVGSCAGDDDTSNDAACVTDFIRSFGGLALRRPLTDQEVAHYETFYAPSTGIDPLGFADVVGGLLNAPQFLYVVEHGDTEVEAQTDTFNLEAYELASRLSYHFWDTMPDERLLDLAATGELLDDATYEGEVERLWGDTRTRETLRGFFREWMKVEDLPELDSNNGATVFQNFAGDDLPSADLRQAMMDEVVDLIDYYTWEQPGGIEQIFTTNYSFAKSDELAGLYGVPAWDGESEPPAFESERPGLLTRALFLSTGTANTRPVMKGVFMRRNVLCDKIPPPPENAMATPPELSPEFSTRQVVEEITEGEGTGCANCHATLINPLGFATESFDSLGRERTEQSLFDQDGAPSGTAAIDTTSIPQVIWGDTTPSEGPSDLMTMVVDSGKPTACAVRHYFRYSFGRWEGVVSDGCVLEQMRLALEETGSLAGMLRAVAMTDAFRRRTFNFEPAQAGDN